MGGYLGYRLYKNRDLKMTVPESLEKKAAAVVALGPDATAAEINAYAKDLKKDEVAKEKIAAHDTFDTFESLGVLSNGVEAFVYTQGRVTRPTLGFTKAWVKDGYDVAYTLPGNPGYAELKKMAREELF